MPQGCMWGFEGQLWSFWMAPWSSDTVLFSPCVFTMIFTGLGNGGGKRQLVTPSHQLDGGSNTGERVQLTRKIASALNKIIQNARFKKKVSLEETKAPKRRPLLPRKTDRLLDLRVLPGHWSQWFCRELCGPICSCSSKWWYSGIRFEMGRNFIINDENLIWWYLGRIVQTKNTRVWETQDRIGIVQYGDSSEESQTWLSQIEDSGEKKYRAEFENEEFWGQKRKFWKERRGQESGDKTAWTKNFRRMLALESQRAVFERRQLQFPTRYQ